MTDNTNQNQHSQQDAPLSTELTYLGVHSDDIADPPVISHAKLYLPEGRSKTELYLPGYHGKKLILRYDSRNGECQLLPGNADIIDEQQKVHGSLHCRVDSTFYPVKLHPPRRTLRLSALGAGIAQLVSDPSQNAEIRLALGGDHAPSVTLHYNAEDQTIQLKPHGTHRGHWQAQEPTSSPIYKLSKTDKPANQPAGKEPDTADATSHSPAPDPAQANPAPEAFKPLQSVPEAAQEPEPDDIRHAILCRGTELARKIFRREFPLFIQRYAELGPENRLDYDELTTQLREDRVSIEATVGPQQRVHLYCQLQVKGSGEPSAGMTRICNWLGKLLDSRAVYNFMGCRLEHKDLIEKRDGETYLRLDRLACDNHCDELEMLHISLRLACQLEDFRLD